MKTRCVVVLLLICVALSEQYYSWPPSPGHARYIFNSFEISNQGRRCTTPPVKFVVVQILGKNRKKTVCGRLPHGVAAGRKSSVVPCNRVGNYVEVLPIGERRFAPCFKLDITGRRVRSHPPPKPQGCPANSYRKGGRCHCSPKFQRRGGKCVPCLRGPDGRNCVRHCPGNSHILHIRNKCVCNHHYKRRGNQCVPGINPYAWCRKDGGKFHWCHRAGGDCLFHDIWGRGHMKVTLRACQFMCENDCRCRGLVYRWGRCWLKNYACRNNQLYRGIWPFYNPASHFYAKLRPHDRCP